MRLNDIFSELGIITELIWQHHSRFYNDIEHSSNGHLIERRTFQINKHLSTVCKQYIIISLRDPSSRRLYLIEDSRKLPIHFLCVGESRAI